MAYIGKTPVLGNFVKLDAISVVNGQAAYTMQNGGVNFTSYDNVNQFLVSLNGILQSPTDSFTVSGSTLTFASNLSTGDVIDFVMVLGNTLDVGTPSDNTVSLAKLTATGTKDATTFLRGDNTFAEAGGGLVQVKYAQTQTAQTIGSASLTDLTSLSLSITPTSSSNKILIQAVVSGLIQASDRGFSLAIVKDSTVVLEDTEKKAFYVNISSGTPEINVRMPFTFLDSPSTTSATTYKIQAKTENGSNVVFNNGIVSSITIMEVSV